MEVTFWILLFLTVYSYAVYPLFLYVVSRVLCRKWYQNNIEPPVSVIISVYNEEAVVEEKVQNALSMEYPKDLLEIIVSSDGSTDRTNEIVSGINDPRLVLKAFTDRLGKTACLNRVLPEARGEIVFFTDANSIFPQDLVTTAVRNFADKEIGLVTGWTKYTDVSGSNETTGLYTRIEKITKDFESMIASCVGADGAVFAMRKNLYRPLRDDDINDFVIPLHVIEQGKRVVLDPEVFCWELSTTEAFSEYRRQVRITTRTLRAIRRNIRFLNPFRFGHFAFFLFSHKVLRFLVPFFLTGVFITNIVILRGSHLYTILLGGQCFVLILAFLSMVGVYRGRIAAFLKYFFTTAIAQAVGWVRMFSGISDKTWTPKR